MKYLYGFKFNTDFSLVQTDDGKYLIERDKAGDITTFDIADGYKGSEPRTFTSNANKYKIESELRDLAPELFAEVYGFKSGGSSDGASGGAYDLDEVVQKVMKSNLELISQVQSHNPYEEAIVEGLISKGKNISEEHILEGVREKIDTYIQEEYGSLPSRIEIVSPKAKKDLAGLFHYQFENILNLVNADVPVLLVGPAGSGKNHTLEQVAEGLDIDFYFSNAVTQEHKISGFTDANGHYHETQFYKAFTQGGLFFLDEMDASIPEVLLVLNSAIANGYYDFPTGREVAHEDFRVVAAANTFGTGADNMYVGRQQLDAATLDRFAVLEFGYDPKVERDLAVNEQLYDFIKEARSTVEQNGIRYTVSMRATINASKLDGVLDTSMIMKSIIFKGLEESDMQLIARNMGYMNNNPYYEAMNEIWS